MNKVGEKRRKFHDSLLKMLYPPPREDHQTPLNCSDDDSVEDEEKIPSSSSDDDGDGDGDGGVDGGQQKLTRAQRKRLRKKKLRLAASQRRPIIGPLLPDNTLINQPDHGPVLVEPQPQPVLHNAAEEPVSGIHNSEEQGASSNQNKLKQRRMAKKLTRDIKDQTDSSHRGL